MSGSDGQAKAEWVRRVLGITIGSGGQGTGGGPVDWATIREVWQDASDTADRQIAALQTALRQSDDEELEDIAEYGLNAVTGNFKVPLMAALREVGGDPALTAKTAPKLLGIVQQFRGHLDTSEAVKVCDENPLNVAVSLRATLGAALERIEQAARRAV